MLKRLITAVLLMSALPLMANAAWFFNTQVKSTGGTIDSRNMTGQGVLDGSIYRSYTTSAGFPVTVTAAPGFTIRSVVINGTSVTPLPTNTYSTTIPGSYSDKSITALFMPGSLTVTASNPGGSVTPSSVGNIIYGYTLRAPLTFTFTPKAGYAITKVSGAPFTGDLTGTTAVSGLNPGWSVPGGVNQNATVTFPTGYSFTNNVVLAATSVNMTPSVDPIPPQTVVINTPTVTLQAAAPHLVDAGATYEWKYVSGPANETVLNTNSSGQLSSTTGTAYGIVPKPDCPLTNANQLSATFPGPPTAGQYKFTFTVKNAYQDSTGTWKNLVTMATVNVVDSRTSQVRNQCQFCHSANQIGPQTPDGPLTLFNNWSSSKHKANGIMCTNCHLGADTGGHPGPITSMSVDKRTFVYRPTGETYCFTCHTPGVTHKTAGITCQYCHSSVVAEIHNPTAIFADDLDRLVCFNCHGKVNTPHYYSNLNNSLSGQCLHCHNNTWDPHRETKAGFFPIPVPAAHFNGYTSFSNPGYAAAYVTPTTLCSNCHKGGDPASSDDVAIRAYRFNWMSSGHGDTTASPWKNGPGHNWKASGQAGVKVSQAGAATDCQRCHTAKGYAQFSVYSTITPIDTAAARYSEPLTCNGCHNADFSVRTLTPRTGYYNYSSVATGKLLVSATLPDRGPSNICMGCHIGRQAGDTIKAMAAAAAANGATTFWSNVSFVNSHYLAAGGEVFGTVGYEYAGQNYSNGVDHSMVGTDAAHNFDGPCVTCHMQATGEATHSHTLNPAVANFAVCNECHGGTMNQSLLDTKSAEFNAALQALGAALSSKGFAPNVVGGVLTYPYFSAKNWGSATTGPANMGAAFNYNLLMHDPGAFAHNPTYVKRLVRDSIDYLLNGSVVRSRSLTTAIADPQLGLDPTTAGLASDFLTNSANGSSACATCHSATVDPVHGDPIVATYNDSKHASVDGGASCADCHLPTGTTEMQHPPQFNMYSTGARVSVNCYNCHTRINPNFNVTYHNWPSQGLCANCHNPHQPWPPAMNIYPHYSTYTSAQYITANTANGNVGMTCNNCHYQASVGTFTVYSANSQWARSSHGDPKGTAYVGPGPYTEANLEAFDFKNLGTSGVTPDLLAANTNPASAAKNDCVRCHTSTGFINYVNPSSGASFTNMAPWGKPGDRAREMVACPTCHTPTPFSDSFSRRTVGNVITVQPDATNSPDWYVNYNVVRVYMNYSSFATKKIKRSKVVYDPNNSNYLDPGESNLCIACHAGRAAGDVIKQTTQAFCTSSPTIACRLGNGNQTQGATNNAANTDPNFWSNVDFIDPHRGTTVNMMYPDNLRPAYEYRTGTTATTYHLGIGYDNLDAPQGPCIGCHMASENKKHAFSPISTASNGTIGGVTTGLCVTCHGNTAFDFGANLVNLQAKKTGYFAALAFIRAQLAGKNIFYNPNVAPYFFQYSDAAQQTYANRVFNWYYNDTTLGKVFQGADLMGAAFNLRLLDSDNGWVHNGTYSKRVLFDTIDYLDDGLTNSVYMTLTTSSLTDAATRQAAQVYIFGNTTNQTRP